MNANGWKVYLLFLLLLISTLSFGQTADFTSDKSTACVDEDVTFTNTSIYEGTGTVSYVWDFGEGASPASSNDTNPEAVYYTQDGAKSITLEMYVDDVLQDTYVGAVTVNLVPTLTLSSAEGTDAQSVCSGAAITSISYDITDATGASVSGITGLSGVYSDGTYTITGTPATEGTYTVTTIGGCSDETIQGTISFTSTPTLTLSSAEGTDAQSLCSGAAITSISYDITDATGASVSGITGLSGVYSDGTYTITGTPTTEGTYTVTTIGGCSDETIQGTISFTSNPTLTLSSAEGTDAQSLCSGTAITSISYDITDATGASVSGITGLSGVYSDGTYTITGTPTTDGTYTVTTIGGCSDETIQGTISFTSTPTLTLSSAEGTDAQSLCSGAVITSISYDITDATGASVSGITGLSGVYSDGTYTITGTPATEGTYTVTTIGGCSDETIQGTISFTSNPTLTLSSAEGTDAQSLCSGAAITSISYDITDATGASVSGITGLSGVYSDGTYTITGTPTTEGTYTVTTIGGCSDETIQGTISFTSNPTLTLSSVEGTDVQSVCSGTEITAISYDITDATGASVSGITGLSGVYSDGTYTITGTPTTEGTYTVTTIGGCSDETIQGAISFTPTPTLTLSSAEGTDAQSVCSGAAITSISYDITDATGASVSGIMGLSGVYSDDTYTITGTPATEGTYTVTTIGGCSDETIQGAISFTSNPTLTLSSAEGTDAQSVCSGTEITSISYDITDATGASVSGITGLSGVYSDGTYTITGTPATEGTYTVTTIGGCSDETIQGTISFTSTPTLTLISAEGTDAQSICINTLLDDITYSIGATATDGDVLGLPAGVIGDYNGGVITISGTPTVTGTFSYTVRAMGSCGTETMGGTITVSPNSEISLSSDNNATQEVCLTASITDITYSVEGSATTASVEGLPAGLGGNYDAGVFTISGTPSESGVFNYMTTASGSCNSAALGGTITVLSNPTINLTSGNSSQSVCLGEEIVSIDYTIGGDGAGGEVSGLPAGITGVFNEGVLSISGTPTETGVFNYTVSTTGECDPVIDGGTITVLITPALTLTSANNTQTICRNNAIEDIIYNIEGSATGASVDGLPSGVTGEFDSGVFTISGSPTVSGTFNYTVTSVSACAEVTAVGSITVLSDHTIGLTSANNTQTVCIDNAIANITYGVGGSATGAEATGLPTGVSATYSSGELTISGSPTVSGTYDYSVSTTGSCSAVTLTGTITVLPDATMSITSGGNNTQTVCVDNAIANITYGVGGSATGAEVSGLPEGVIGGFDNGTFTVSGTPTEAGTFNYTVTTTGSCESVSLGGTLTVTDDATITLTTNNSNQGVCINTLIDPIEFLVGGSGTGGSVSGLPLGVNWSYIDNVISINGTPTLSGDYDFTVSVTGSCSEESATGTIRVSSDATITLSSASRNQTVCLNSPMEEINYAIGGSGNGGNVTGLPTGITGVFSNGILTITGTPTETGTFSYIANATSSCGEAQTSGTITVLPNAGINLTSANNEQTLCVGTSIANITYAISGSASDGEVQGLPAGVTGVYSNNVITISGKPTEAGIFEYTAITKGSCSDVTASGIITVVSSASLNLTSSNNDQSVCINSPITDITYSILGSVDEVTVTGLPSGVNGTLNEGVFVISGIPTVSGTFNFEVSATGSCANATASGTITVRPDAQINLTSSNNTQNVCVGSRIQEITYAVSGSVNNVSVSELPGGVNYTYNNNVLTISGIPVSVGAFNYTVTVSGDCASAMATGTIEVNALPTAKISGTTAVCQSEESPLITFEGAMGIEPYTFTYSVNSGEEQTITTTDGSIATIAVSTQQEGVFTYALLSVSDSSPSGCSQTQTGSATVTIHALPTATISGNAQVCQGSESPYVTFTGDDGQAPYTFYYAVNGGETQSVTSTTGSVAQVEVSTDASGDFTYELLSVRDASSAQCERSQSGSVEVSVISLPQAEISGSTSVCLNDASPEIILTGSDGTPPYTFEYTVNGGDVQSISTTTGNSVTIQVPTDGIGTFEYELLSVWDNSALSCSNLVTGNATVIVKDLPLATIEGTASVCIGDTSPEVTFTGTNGVEPYVFYYTINGEDEQNITSTGGNSVSLAVSTDVSGEFLYELVRVEDSDENSCENMQEGSAQVSVYETPVANAGEGGNNCGLRFIFNATASIGNGTWTMMSGPGTASFSPDANTPDAEVVVDQYGIYEFVWTETNGSCSDSESVLVNFLEGTSAFAGEDQAVCDVTATLNAQTEGNGIWALYDGPGDAVFSPDVNDANANVTVSEYGTYQFQWTELNHICQSSDIVEVTFSSLPEVSAGNDTIICLGDEIQLQASGEGSFSWEPLTTLDDPFISNPYATPTESATYTVTLTNEWGCANQDEVWVETWTQPEAYAGEDMELAYTFELDLEAAAINENESGLWEVLGGDGVIQDETSPVTAVSGLSIGTNLLRWTVTNEVCPSSVDFLTLRVSDLIIPTLITPNNDGKNEKFIIGGIETFGKTELVIFNRRGIQVYKNSDYDNSWNGVDQNGNPLPDDTYYYTFKPTNGKTFSGFIVIRR